MPSVWKSAMPMWCDIAFSRDFKNKTDLNKRIKKCLRRIASTYRCSCNKTNKTS